MKAIAYEISVGGIPFAYYDAKDKNDLAEVMMKVKELSRGINLFLYYPEKEPDIYTFKATPIEYEIPDDEFDVVENDPFNEDLPFVSEWTLNSSEAVEELEDALFDLEDEIYNKVVNIPEMIRGDVYELTINGKILNTTAGFAPMEEDGLERILKILNQDYPGYNFGFVKNENGDRQIKSYINKLIPMAKKCIDNYFESENE